MKRSVRAALLVVALARPGYAQLPSSSAAALGLGDNYTAVARGYAAVAWNPALLALPDNPRTSLAILPVRTIAGLDPVTLADIAEYGGEFLPATVREEWLTRIEREGSQQGTGGGDVTWLAVQAGRFAAQFSSTLRALSNVTPGAAELILFGNYGRTSTPRAFDLDGSQLSGFAISTMAVSYGHPVGRQMTAGATLKYTAGHVLMHGEDRGTAFTADPTADINFPVVETRSGDFGKIAGGFGMDVGFAMVRGAWTFGAAVQNVFNTFRWDRGELVFRAGLGTFDTETHVTDFEEQGFANAPTHLQEFVEDARFGPVLAAGLAYAATRELLLSADFRRQLTHSSLEIAPTTHLGVGAEYLLQPRVPVRAGIAYVEGGYQLTGGAGVDFGPVGIAASIARRDTDLGVDTIVMLTLISTLSR